MNAIEQYIKERDEQVRKNMTDRDLSIDTHRFTESLVRTNYIKNFTWQGIPILQFPTDIMVMQELIWQIKPAHIIEIGTAFAGMTKFYDDMQKMIGENGGVISIDIDIREHAVEVIDRLYNTIAYELPSTSKEVISAVKNLIREDTPVLVSLDSHHTHDHVLKELKLYSPLVSVGSYIVVFDTSLEFYGNHDNREWGKGNSPYTAIQEFLKDNDSFVVDKDIEQRAVITSAVGGWLRRTK